MDGEMLTADVLAKYYSRRLEDLETCRQSLASRDFETIERIGHKLKGNGVTFGFPELSKLGEELETSAQQSDWGHIQNQLKAFEGWIHENSRQFEVHGAGANH